MKRTIFSELDTDPFEKIKGKIVTVRVPGIRPYQSSVQSFVGPTNVTTCLAWFKALKPGIPAVEVSVSRKLASETHMRLPGMYLRSKTFVLLVALLATTFALPQIGDGVYKEISGQIQDMKYEQSEALEPQALQLGQNPPTERTGSTDSINNKSTAKTESSKNTHGEIGIPQAPHKHELTNSKGAKETTYQPRLTTPETNKHDTTKQGATTPQGKGDEKKVSGIPFPTSAAKAVAKSLDTLTLGSGQKTNATANLNSNAGSLQENANPNEEEKEVCFPVVGCFAMGKPWKSALRPIAQPDSPEKIQTTIFFYSRSNANKQTNITLHPQIEMNGASFDPKKITAIIVHGFASSGNAIWMKEMKDVYLKALDANVMLVNWELGSNLVNYLKVAGNTRVVGKQLAIFVKYIINGFKADPSKIHLIGHSLGAQICSYLAKDVPGISRLTALDPAQPGFEGFDPAVRLDKSDAKFVEVIHTSAKPLIPTLGFGMIAPYGHIDFYMNGGFDQPGCIILPKEELPEIKSIGDLAKFPVEAISKVISCAHGRSYEFLIESYNKTENCTFWGHKADITNVLQGVTNTLTQGVFKKAIALGNTCNKEDCVPMGFATIKSPLRGSFVVTTSPKRPFCIPEKEVPNELDSLATERTTTTTTTRQSVIQKITKKVRLS